MKADIKWLDNPEVFRMNQLPAHSDHICYGSREEAVAGKSSLYQMLDGEWKFKYSVNSLERPMDFYREDFDVSGFDSIKVPCHIEMAGYDNIHYINTMYPWEGHKYRRPAYSIGRGGEAGSFSEDRNNPVGSYLQCFDLDSGLIGKRVCICFEGVEQAMYVWLNGEFVGYAEDSFTPSEFDLSPYIRETGNILAVEVHKRSTAAYLEDQDFFRFFGIFRSVSLYAKPEVHIEDMWAKPELKADNRTGSFAIWLKLSYTEEPGDIKIMLRESGRCCYSKRIPASEQIVLEPEDVGEVKIWDHHHPTLYELTLEVYKKTGEMVEAISYQTGFRRIEIINKVMMLNGKRLKVNGVNRHEWGADCGRCIGMKEMKKDMQVFCHNNINAVRTSHYPNQIPWYRLCDENGIYVMSETNLESHGSWQKMGAIEPSWNVPGSLPQWKEAVVDRARTNFETFKNHISIIFWSLGNESYAGDNIAYMNQFFKEADSTRLVHYEGVIHNRAYEETISDIESRMYAPPAEIREYLEKEPAKPFLVCEYMHDMGNSLGGMKSYIELLDEYDMYQGGFIWDYIDQALWIEDEISGQKVLRYGGDFDDRPSDYEFSGNGVVFADRTEKPAMQEVRYYYGLHK